MCFFIAKILLLLMFSITGNAWSNPFEASFEYKQSDQTPYYSLKSPFVYPFEQASELNNYQLNLEKFSQLMGENEKLNQLKKIYQTFPYDQKINLYRYSFSVAPNWDILAYPLIDHIADENPKKWIGHFENSINEHDSIQDFKFIQSIDDLTQSISYSNNKTRLLKTPDSFDEILYQLNNAKNHVFMSSFLFQCDAGTEDLIKLMQTKVSQGVDIYLIIDKTFTLIDKKCAQRLKDTGAKVYLKGNKFQIFHEKMYVFDGEYAIVDGQNLLAAQTLSNGRNNLINDTAIGLQGPIVQEIALHFMRYWQESKLAISTSLKNFYALKKWEAQIYRSQEQIEKALAEKTGLCRLVVQKPGAKNKTIMPLYESYVKQAQKYLFFNMIDLRFERHGNKLGNDFIKLVIEKTNQNSDLRVDMLSNQWKAATDVVLPEDMATQQNWFSKIVIKPMFMLYKRPHLQITKGRKRFFKQLNNKANFNWWASAMYNHSKTMMVDNVASFVGSFNINSASNKNSFEQVIVCHDQELTNEMQKGIVQDLINSIPIPLKK
jgi:phosphatidylserine/phosphatidylglycerophosphate/cardiolipin synthase-like enzyme